MALDPVPRGLANRLPWNWQSYGPVTGNSEQGPASLQGMVLGGGAAQNEHSLWAATERAQYVSQMNQSDNPLLGSWPEVKKWVERGLRCSPRRGPSSGKQAERGICVPPRNYRALPMMPGRQTLNVNLTLLTIMIAMSNSTTEVGKLLSHRLRIWNIRMLLQRDMMRRPHS